MKIYTEQELKQTIQLNKKIIQVIEEGFTSLVTKKVGMPPIMRIDIPEHHGEVDVKTAYIPGFDKFALKLSSGFFNNHLLGLPSGNGMMILLSSETGIPQAIFLDNGYLTDVRTAAAGAISAQYFAKKQVQTAGVIGVGSQARYQMLALKHVRSYEKLLVYGRNTQKTQAFKAEMENALQVKIEICDSVEKVVKNSDVVVTTTPAEQPILKADWLHPGLHITAMGSDAEHKQEIASAVFREVDQIACDVKAQCVRLGELHHAVNEGVIMHQTEVTELGQVTSGKVKGRTSDQEITICDLTGTGVQDTAIALATYDELKSKPIGIEIDN